MPNSEGGGLTEEANETPNEVQIPYANIVRIVELRQGDQMYQGDLSILSRSGWKFETTERDSVRAIAYALAVQEEALSLVEEDVICINQEDPVPRTLRQLYDARVRDSASALQAGLPLPVWRRLELDEAVYGVVRPSDIAGAVRSAGQRRRPPGEPEAEWCSAVTDDAPASGLQDSERRERTQPPRPRIS